MRKIYHKSELLYNTNIPSNKHVECMKLLHPYLCFEVTWAYEHHPAMHKNMQPNKNINTFPFAVIIIIIASRESQTYRNRLDSTHVTEAERPQHAHSPANAKPVRSALPPTPSSQATRPSNHKPASQPHCIGSPLFAYAAHNKPKRAIQGIPVCGRVEVTSPASSSNTAQHSAHHRSVRQYVSRFGLTRVCVSRCAWKEVVNVSSFAARWFVRSFVRGPMSFTWPTTHRSSIFSLRAQSLRVDHGFFFSAHLLSCAKWTRFFPFRFALCDFWTVFASFSCLQSKNLFRNFGTRMGTVSPFGGIAVPSWPECLCLLVRWYLN